MDGPSFELGKRQDLGRFRTLVIELHINRRNPLFDRLRMLESDLLPALGNILLCPLARGHSDLEAMMKAKTIPGLAPASMGARM